MKKNRTEISDLSKNYPEIVSHLAAQYELWASDCNILPCVKILHHREQKNWGALEQSSTSLERLSAPPFGINREFLEAYHFES